MNYIEYIVSNFRTDGTLTKFIFGNVTVQPQRNFFQFAIGESNDTLWSSMFIIIISLTMICIPIYCT